MPDPLVSDLARMDATDQARLVAEGAISPSELVEAAIERIERFNPQINAVVTPLFEQARIEAASKNLPKGPFRGVPLLLKDLGCHVAGIPVYGGTRFLKDRKFIAQQDSTLAVRFRAAGFVFVGKTNTPELGLSPTTEPDSFGPTRNPWNLDRIVGGSSGGSAAAVAAGLTPLAHAGDGGPGYFGNGDVGRGTWRRGIRHIPCPTTSRDNPRSDFRFTGRKTASRSASNSWLAMAPRIC